MLFSSQARYVLVQRLVRQNGPCAIVHSRVAWRRSIVGELIGQPSVFVKFPVGSVELKDIASFEVIGAVVITTERAAGEERKEVS